jgi:hypothetical protein
MSTDSEPCETKPAERRPRLKAICRGMHAGLMFVVNWLLQKFTRST